MKMLLVRLLTVILFTVLHSAQTSRVEQHSDAYYIRPSSSGCKARCGAGRECILGDDGKMKCVCSRTCKKHYRPVCGDDGILYINHCELHRRACISKQHVAIDHTNKCTRKGKTCSKDHLRALHLELLSILKAEQPGKYKLHELVDNLFKQYDVDNDRKLDKYELNGMLDDYVVYKPIKLQLLSCGPKDWIKSADQDGDYILSQVEFIKQLDAYSEGKGQEQRTVTIKIREGTSILIPTVVTNSHSKVVWKLDGENINLANTDKYSITQNGSLLISPIYVDDSGTYTACLKDILSYCQTTILDIGAPPLVHLRPVDPVINEGETLVFECNVTGKPEPSMQWEKEGDVYREHYGPLRGNLIQIQNAKESDMGLYRCSATNAYGTSSDKAMLTVRAQDGFPTIDVFAVFGENGINIIDPENAVVTQKIDGSTVIKGTDKPICNRHKVIKCRWGPAVNVRNKYLYASDITNNRIIVFDVNSLIPLEEIPTVLPVREMRYIKIVDKVLVIVRKLEDVDNEEKLEDEGQLLIIPQASQEKQHVFFTMTQRDDDPQVNPGHIEVPPCSQMPTTYTTAYITSLDYPGFYVLDLINDKYKIFVNMSSDGCKQVLDIAYSYKHDYAFVHCSIDDEYDITAQFVVDMKNRSRVRMNKAITGRTHISPDGRYTLSFGQNNGYLISQYIDDKRKIHNLKGILTSVMLSDVAFYQKSTGYDVYITTKDYASMVILNIDSTKVKTVKILMNVGKPFKVGFDWESTKRNIVLGCARDTHYAVSPATADQKVIILDLQQRSIKGTVHGVRAEGTVILLQRQE